MDFRSLASDKGKTPTAVDQKVIEKILGIPGHTSCVYYVGVVDDKGAPQFDESHTVNLSPLVSASVVNKNNLFGIGSITKTIIATALGFIVEEPRTLQNQPPDVQRIVEGAWCESAFGVLNRLRLARKLPTLTPPYRLNPSVKELLLHIQAFAPDQRYLFGPEGSFLMSDKVFEEIIADLGNRVDETPTPNASYSNWNYVIAAMIIKDTMGTSLPEALKTLVLEPLGMERTVLDLDEFSEREWEMAEAFIDTIDRGCRRVSRRPCYLRDTTELAVGGGYSCVEDIAKLLKFLFKKLIKKQWKGFFDAHEFEINTSESWTSVLGNYGPLDSQVVGMQSYDRTGQTGSYQLGKLNGESHDVISKAGAVKGYSCHHYIVPRKGLFVIVLTNSSGIIDTSNHIGQYILQQTLGLEPAVDFVKEARKIYNSRREYLSKSKHTGIRSNYGVFSPDELRSLVGVFKHEMSRQRITISHKNRKAEIFIDGMSSTDQRRTRSLEMFKVSENTMTLRPLSGETTIDGYDAWFDLEFKIQKEEGRVSALVIESSASQKDVYERVP